MTLGNTLNKCIVPGKISSIDIIS